jgi:hypothetical protein
MKLAMQKGYVYVVAAIVGACFGALSAGAVLFVLKTGAGAPIESLQLPSAPLPR